MEYFRDLSEFYVFHFLERFGIFSRLLKIFPVFFWALRSTTIWDSKCFIFRWPCFRAFVDLLSTFSGLKVFFWEFIWVFIILFFKPLRYFLCVFRDYFGFTYRNISSLFRDFERFFWHFSGFFATSSKSFMIWGPKVHLKNKKNKSYRLFSTKNIAA